VRLNSSNITKDIFIPGKASKNANDKDAVIVKILRWEQKNPEGKIVDIV
jgi:exoribonuclease R